MLPPVEQGNTTKSVGPSNRFPSRILTCAGIKEKSVPKRQREGPRREPDTRSVRIATRRARWRPFARPSCRAFASCGHKSPATRAPLSTVVANRHRTALPAFNRMGNLWRQPNPVSTLALSRIIRRELIDCIESVHCAVLSAMMLAKEFPIHAWIRLETT
jgi:hypothetical protein